MQIGRWYRSDRTIVTATGAVNDLSYWFVFQAAKRGKAHGVLMVKGVLSGVRRDRRLRVLEGATPLWVNTYDVLTHGYHRCGEDSGPVFNDEMGIDILSKQLEKVDWSTIEDISERDKPQAITEDSGSW